MGSNLAGFTEKNTQIVNFYKEFADFLVDLYSIFGLFVLLYVFIIVFSNITWYNL